MLFVYLRDCIVGNGDGIVFDDVIGCIIGNYVSDVGVSY